MTLRASKRDEHQGLNSSEHQVGTELQQLLTEMDEHRTSGDFAAPVSVESLTEVGQVAAQYNRVLSVINSERRQLVRANQEAHTANQDLIDVQSELQRRMGELSEFNEVSVGREMRMIELKEEINALRAQAGLSPRYDVGTDTPSTTGRV